MGSDSDSSWGSDHSVAKVKKPTRYKMAICGVTAICGLLGLVFFIWGIANLTKTVEAGTCNCVSVNYNAGTCGTSTSQTTPSSTPSFSTTSSSPSTQKEMEDASRVRQADVAAPTRYPSSSRTPVRSPVPSPPTCQQATCEVTVLFSTGGNLRMDVSTNTGDLPQSCPGDCTGQPQDFECWKSGDNAYSSESAAKGGGAVPLVLGLIFLFCGSGWIAYFVYKLRKYNEKKAAKKEKKRIKKNQVMNVEANPAPQTSTQPYPQQPGQAPPQAYAPQGYAPQQVPNQPYPPQQQYAPPPGYNPAQPPPGYNPAQPPPGYNPAQAGAPNVYQPIQPPPPGYQG